MTNNENKIDKEKAIELIAGRIDDEFKKHPQLNWQKIAASKIHSQWFEQSQSALEEKQRDLEQCKDLANIQQKRWIERNEQLQSSLTTKDKEIEELKIQYKVLDEENSELVKEIEGLKKECDKYEAQMLKDGSTIQSLKEEIEELKDTIIARDKSQSIERGNLKDEIIFRDRRIKELEEGIKRIKENWQDDKKYSWQDIYDDFNSLLSPSKEK